MSTGWARRDGVSREERDGGSLMSNGLARRDGGCFAEALLCSRRYVFFLLWQEEEEDEPPVLCFFLDGDRDGECGLIRGAYNDGLVRNAYNDQYNNTNADNRQLG